MAKELTVNKAVRLCLTSKLDFKDFKAIYELYKETNYSLLGNALVDSVVVCETEDEMKKLNEIKDSLKLIVKEPEVNKEISISINKSLTQKMTYEEFVKMYELYKDTRDKLLGKALSLAVIDGSEEELIKAREYMDSIKEELKLEDNKKQGL